IDAGSLRVDAINRRADAYFWHPCRAGPRKGCHTYRGILRGAAMHHYKLSALLLALAALAPRFVVAALDDVEAFASGSFNPTTTVTLADHNPNAASDQNVTLNIPVNDYNFSAVVNASPAASFLAPGPGNPAFVSGTHPAKGDEMGTLSSSTFLGLTNN